MKNISSVIKNNFLILGFTGPLRSGCSTAANFFAEGSFRTHKQTRSFQYIDLRISTSYQGQSIKALKEALVDRDILATLSSYELEKFNFHKISMSSVILKYVIEYIFRHKIFSHVNYKDVLEILSDFSFNELLVNKVSKAILDKNYDSLTEEDYARFDAYLTDIDTYKDKIRKNLNFQRYVEVFQNFGDNIRGTGNPFELEETRVENVTNIAISVHELVKFFRRRRDEKRTNYFVIDSFRNPYEVEYFRYRYYEFYLVSVTASLDSRKLRDTYSERADVRDSGGETSLKEIHKQNVSKCVYLSDIQIDNSKQRHDHEDLNYKLLKFFTLILSPGCIPPSGNEVFMSQAYMISLKSTCISRQVGAIIESEKGYVVGAGWNDVGQGQIGCGLRRIEDVQNLPNEIVVTNPEVHNGFRESLKAHCKDELFCFKDTFSEYMIANKIKDSAPKMKKQLADAGINLDESDVKKIADIQLTNMKVKRLEFCRALHAEENALLQSAKIGGMGVMGGTLYTTSFPCELCAKKIYQSGINKVVYSEPYPDSISQDVILRDGVRQIELIPFEGVKSHSFYRLYKSDFDKKELQQLEKLYP